MSPSPDAFLLAYGQVIVTSLLWLWAFLEGGHYLLKPVARYYFE